MISVFATVDNSRLQAAVAMRIRVLKSSRTAEQVVTTAAYWIAVNTKNNTPFVDQDTISSELGVIVNPVITKTGKVSTNKKRKFETVTFGRGAARNDVPLVALIISARANPNSNYNLTTNGRYAIAKNPFKGVSPAEGAQAMLEMARRMRAGRASSTHFIQSGWIAVIRDLRPYAILKRRAGEPPALEGAAYDHGGDPRGQALVMGNDLQVAVFIENSTGMDGINAANFNRALWMVGYAPFQAAIDRETGLMEDYVNQALAAGNMQFDQMCK